MENIVMVIELVEIHYDNNDYLGCYQNVLSFWGIDEILNCHF